MTSVGVNVPRQELSIPRGSTATLRLAVSKGATPYDLTLPGSVLVVTGSHRGVRLFQHVYVQGGGALHGLADDGSFTINPTENGVPAGPSVAYCRIGSADTRGLVASDVVAWDAWLYTSDGQVDPIVVGTIRVEALPFTPA
jgi:hypothetical protein